jgi:hypothetical protein
VYATRVPEGIQVILSPAEIATLHRAALDGLEQLEIGVEMGMVARGEYEQVAPAVLEFANALLLLDDDLIVSTFLEPHRNHEGDDLVKQEELLREALVTRRELLAAR